MASITPDAVDQRGYVIVLVDLTGLTGNLAVRVYRNEYLATGEVQKFLVRPNGYTYTATNRYDLFMVPSGTDAIFYDSEAPLDEAFFYTMQTIDRDTGVLSSNSSVVSPEVILMSDKDLWIKDPIRPYLDRRVTLKAPAGDPSCIPGRGIFFQSMGAINYNGRSTGLIIQNQARTVGSLQVRSAAESSINLVTRTIDDRDDMTNLLATGDVLFWQGPAHYGEPDRYINVGDVSINRITIDHRRPWRLISMPWVEQDAPIGAAYGVLGTRWIDYCLTGTTYDGAETAGMTWEQMTLGMSNPFISPPVSTMRTYAQVNTEFASYTAVAAGGRTYQQLLEGF